MNGFALDVEAIWLMKVKVQTLAVQNSNSIRCVYEKVGYAAYYSRCVSKIKLSKEPKNRNCRDHEIQTE